MHPEPCEVSPLSWEATGVSTVDDRMVRNHAKEFAITKFMY